MRVAAFDFDLPRACIADHPVDPRDGARLLVVGEGLADHGMRDLPALLRPGDVLVVNDTRVIPARLFGRRGEARIEVTLHRDLGEGRWRALARPARKLAPGDSLRFADELGATVEARGERGEVTVRFDRAGEALTEALDRHGAMPLPPYIRRPEGAEARDIEDYQTVYAAHPGAVAAPTAGLHFTDELLDALARTGIGRAAVTLHVGAGTFRPVSVADTADHRMEGEWGRIGADTAAAVNEARRQGGRVVAVGSTALRLLETAADAGGTVQPFTGETSLFVTPGFRFQAVDLLLTNFHLPRSTLFMMVAAFSGLERMRAAYAHALAAGYRFYSYGDACLLHPARAP
ncbi:MAG: tRNA preQ1(34) S-adenosylmethionine ribosyltransferase-isomerase QueA [Alphaproteobacteria bacterium]|jgi:S-adenosylmethionine:tRNA ribosyltransferase-isomerase|nr:tRNA preQ1(34) S-adenosylmethionine ribosyltransferase-isomerase QueA [Alphaproteobacteria bacterium]MDP6515157.1 tRNA preQ1(34) S-adenosylmethionine ribosyltransferase-isomerase QueA [Alphaproteobacteria bacterium]